MFKEYLILNWPLILVLAAFSISLLTTVFSDKKTIRRMYSLIAVIFLLSIVVFIEFYFAGNPDYRILRTVLIVIRYSATPVIIAMICFALVTRLRWFIFLPAISLIILNVISAFTGIIFTINASNNIVHGPIWLAPYIMVGLYSIFLIYILIKHSNKRPMEIIPIIFLAASLASGLVLPFIIHEAFSSLFCVTIAIALYTYYEFSLHQLTKKDSLTGLLNRHAYFADINNDPKSITALISIDMNGLKNINDNVGHPAGDEALSTLAECFKDAITNKQSGYRVGGDEFIIVCRKTPKEEVLDIVEQIKKNVANTKYTCSIGYSFNLDGDKPISDLLRESDEMMYLDKEQFYKEPGNNRRERA